MPMFLSSPAVFLIMSKAQAAVEYTVLIAFTLMLLAVVWFYSKTTISKSTEDLNVEYAKNTVEKLKDAANFVFVQGKPASVKISVYIPNNVREIRIYNTTVYFRVLVGGRYSDVYAYTMGNVTGNISLIYGYQPLIVRAEEGYVNITY